MASIRSRSVVTTVLVATVLVGWPQLAGAASSPGSGSALAAAPDYSAAVAEINADAAKLMDLTHTVGATITLVDGDKVILRRGYGFADRETQKPVTPDTLFHIGSVSKTFSAAAVMQLVEKGLVDLDAPLTTYVPDLHLLPRYKDNVITVRSVLDHHSGIPGDVFNGLITERKPFPAFRDLLIEMLGGMPPERRVNTEFAYNNAGYVLLQDVVENVTGQSFEDYAKAHLFELMDMPSSSFNDVNVPAGRLTRNYAPEPDAEGAFTGPIVRMPREYVNGWTAGSIVSSGRDMTNYLQMLLKEGKGASGTVLKPSTLRSMWTAQTHLPIDLQYDIGLSWFLMPGAMTGMGPMRMHDGATGYNFSYLAVLPESGLGVFVSTNTLGGMDFSSGIGQRALQLAYTAKTGKQVAPNVKLPTERVPGSDAMLAPVAGRYATAEGYATVNYGAGYLLLTRHAESAAPGAPAETVSYAPTPDGWWTSSDTPDFQVGFQELGGKRLMLARIGGAPQVRYYVLGQFAVVQQIPDQWRARYGTYRAVNRVPNSVGYLTPDRVVLGEMDGLVTLNTGSLGVQVLRPITGDSAFSFGVGIAVGRRKGDIVSFHGGRMTFMGITYERISR